jgi:hypothetical protein
MIRVSQVAVVLLKRPYWMQALRMSSVRSGIEPFLAAIIVLLFQIDIWKQPTLVLTIGRMVCCIAIIVPPKLGIYKPNFSFDFEREIRRLAYERQRMKKKVSHRLGRLVRSFGKN